ncbi:putative UDP-3-O-acyl N-acetylglucosamine deacetylase [Oceanicola granulosus HTCC2516]|uniref:UDP-3-O-acyl-N-acetylglucosamine deacetylase n=1 Tax=Oceanicola granulosus (strain ATCC BAA-861 / DSM 15982 / KCTC 12143 / HTCC2516) TaxID=314256 RepID=Q2CIW7_OCEGH|nr:UDP-3-O-acyl-N-acetylglucosamine deacetylase [Oceanicola granulosus]EAR52472.1 putative UDP-3-O-acyl N-acetylglucosamine deacetylase [Oceanicola granulosus HTCC2516]
MQATLTKPVWFEGVGLHTGRPVHMGLFPAPANHGIVFVRGDLGAARVPARWDLVEQSPLMTRIVAPEGADVATVEHVMAALAGCGVANARVVLDGPEAPIADGSAAPFVRGILAAGLTAQRDTQRAIRILRPVEVRRGDALARLSPATSLQIDFEIDFADPAIGRQHKVLNMANGAFVRELCDSRTFCRNDDIDAMHSNGLALGGSLENAVVVDGARVLTPGGLRHADEAVRHKMLDALGDLALAGAPILGRYTGIRAGHTLTNRLLRALFADPAAWTWVPCDANIDARLPGSGLSHADLHAVA